jgi:dTDP-4-dehydrorhamnose 3,5-epimerase
MRAVYALGRPGRTVLGEHPSPNTDASVSQLKTFRTERLELLVVEPAVFGDARGWFAETWNRRRYGELGLPADWVQDNVSHSRRGVLRGMHFQHPDDQAKLVWVLRGEVFDAAVDVRVGSPTFGRWDGLVLSAENHRQLFLPQGFAHGFLVLSDEAQFVYKVAGGGYNPKAEVGMLWNDPAIGIEWPERGSDGRALAPVLSPKDGVLPTLAELVRDGRLPRYRP